MAQTFPNFTNQPGLTICNFRINGTNVGASAGTAGLDGRGKFLCTISKSANQVTINWNNAWGDIPYVFFQGSAGQTDWIVEEVTSTASQLVFNTKVASTNAPLNNANLDVVVFGYNTTSFMS